MRAGYLRAARDIFPECTDAGEEIGQQRLSPFFLVARPGGGGRPIPVTAMISMVRVVVLPPPRRPAVTQKVGRSGSSERSMMVSAALISMHFPV